MKKRIIIVSVLLMISAALGVVGILNKDKLHLNKSENSSVILEEDESSIINENSSINESVNSKTKINNIKIINIVKFFITKNDVVIKANKSIDKLDKIDMSLKVTSVSNRAKFTYEKNVLKLEFYLDTTGKKEFYTETLEENIKDTHIIDTCYESGLYFLTESGKLYEIKVNPDFVGYSNGKFEKKLISDNVEMFGKFTGHYEYTTCGFLSVAFTKKGGNLSDQNNIYVYYNNNVYTLANYNREALFDVNLNIVYNNHVPYEGEKLEYLSDDKGNALTANIIFFAEEFKLFILDDNNYLYYYPNLYKENYNVYGVLQKNSKVKKIEKMCELNNNCRVLINYENGETETLNLTDLNISNYEYDRSSDSSYYKEGNRQAAEYGYLVFKE